MAIDNNNPQNLYSTTDTALAAWLYSQGLELADVDSSEFPSVFYFKNSDPKLQQIVRDFQCGKAEGNIIVFFRAYKKLLGKIKAGRI